MHRIGVLLVVCAVLAALSPATVGAQGVAVDPLDIAVTVDDLPPEAAYRFVETLSEYGDLSDGSGRYLSSWFVRTAGSSAPSLHQYILRINSSQSTSTLLRN